MKILVLGATGMLGNAMVRVLSEDASLKVRGTIRNRNAAHLLPIGLRDYLVDNVDVENIDQVAAVLAAERPNVIINCVGLVKQFAQAEDPLAAVPINALLPHRLAQLASLINARLIHFSTDCVFSGAKGGYAETDISDAKDLYGRSKYLGEVSNTDCLTVRTSIIGHELNGGHSLVGWFLAQKGPVKGFTRAVFSGLPTVELSRIIRDIVLERPDLSGVWHVGSDPIAKYDLLKLVGAAYGHSIEIIPDSELVIDRSLDSSRFREATGYVPANWLDLVEQMRNFG